MGNFHCIPESCARIVYREYLPSVIRWKYPDEDWHEIEGAVRYELINNKLGQVKLENSSRCSPGRCIDTWRELHNREIWFNHELITANALIQIRNNGQSVACPYDNLYTILIDGFDVGNVTIENANGQTVTYVRGNKFVGTFSCVTIEDTSGSAVFSSTPNITKTKNSGCEFKIFGQNDNLLYERVENYGNCPEVEQLPCRLSDEYKEIKIEKSPYLERVEVRDQALEYVALPVPLLDASPLPDNCLNIYKTLTTAPPFISNYVPIPAPFHPFIFIGQICSAESCPPPEYEVICDCGSCEECPDGTCPVECHGVVCCYDTSTGKAIKQIPIDDYCGG